MHGDDTPRGTVGNEIVIHDDNQISVGGYGTSGKTVRFLLEWVFPFGRPVDEVLARVDRERAAQQALTADLERVIAYARDIERRYMNAGYGDGGKWPEHLRKVGHVRQDHGVGDLLDRED